ncbi:ABC transporter substrate-binding protein [Methanolobus vulcani]|uniref:ABC transporter substrate-binding protein n=1 Tax=Methanolobus vulcani TaxID=38026 RepID=A0A7Z8P3M8_9EURY|nr:ABC transporter substrate-binding protein [Methanolobus vulcani]TQD29541.1 ABC transporter substrate-binding protein [Methanolobus vulcani]
MKTKVILVLLIAISCILMSGCMGESISEDNDSIEDTYDPTMDYFPDKVDVEYAIGFSVEYHNNYKFVTVTDPKTSVEYSYVLVQKGTPVPEGYSDSLVVEIPVESIVALPISHIPALDVIGEVDKLKAVGNFNYVNSVPVRELIEEGAVEEVGSGNEVNVESIVEINPDIVSTLTTDMTGSDEYIFALKDMGLKPVSTCESKEESPLGRAEWVKFMSLFFNDEKKANEYFAKVSENYTEMAQLANNVEERPIVMAEYALRGTWYAPGGNSFIAQFVKDAGGVYLWENDNNTESFELDFEYVLDKGKDSDYWFVSADWDSIEAMESYDPLYLEFNPAKTGNVYTCYYRVYDTGEDGGYGGNDYYESGVLRPDIVLADYIKILHPELLPDYELYYHKQLESTSEDSE